MLPDTVTVQPKTEETKVAKAQRPRKREERSIAAGSTGRNVVTGRCRRRILYTLRQRDFCHDDLVRPGTTERAVPEKAEMQYVLALFEEDSSVKLETRWCVNLVERSVMLQKLASCDEPTAKRSSACRPPALQRTITMADHRGHDLNGK